MIKILILALILAFSPGTNAQQSEGRSTGININKYFTNPVFDGADPWFIQKDGFYYYCFSSGNGISIYRTEFLTKRGEAKKVWEAPATGWNRSCIWAPELHFLDGRWYIYYAAGESGPPYIHQKTGVLQSVTDDALGSYIDLGMLYTGDNPDMHTGNIWAIDMTVFRFREKLYAAWSGWEKPADTDKTSQHLYIAEMSNPYTIKGPRVKISSPVEKWETGGPLDLQEGPEILEKGGKLFIVYSCRESWTVDYRLGMLEFIGKDLSLFNPRNWKKSGPVFQGPTGTGHCSFVKSPDGKEDWIIYHSKKSIKEGWQREISMQPFKWTKSDDPVFGEPVAKGTTIRRPSGEYRIERKRSIRQP